MSGVETRFELGIIQPDGTRGLAEWDGKTGEDACRRYADAHPGTTVRKWRPQRTGVFPVNLNTIRIVEPGDKA